MTWIDYLVIAVPFVAIVYFGVRAQSYVTGVSDFLSAGRCAGRYLIGVAAGEATLGLITVVNYCEIYYKSGWSFFFWQNLLYAAIWIMALTGFVNYRYRETRVLTMAQLLEERYSRSFRIFTGMLSFVAGLINYALFPAVAGRFLIYYCQLPDAIVIGSLHISTFGFLMAICLGVALLITLSGGQLTTMVTDCLQGIFTYFVFTVLLVVVIVMFSGAQFEYSLTSCEAGKSLLNPFDISGLTDFNLMYVMIGVFTAIYTRMAWQGTQGYNCAGASPHEQKMGGLISSWRYNFTPLMTIILVMAAYTFMNHPDFAEQAALVRSELATRINDTSAATTATLRSQMLVPVSLRTLLPVGFAGAFAAVMVFMMLSTDTTYLHSWGSILIQDVILPFRKRPFRPKTQMLLLRCSILFVAVFAWVFSMYFGQVTFIAMFFAITGAIYLAGAGSVIIGGLYWRRGTAAGAWTAMIVGAVFGIVGFALPKIWVEYYYSMPEWFVDSVRAVADFLNAHLGAFGRWEMSPTRFPVTGQELAMLGMLLSVASYIVVSLATCREKFDLDKLLNRGKYNLEHKGDAGASVDNGGKRLSWRRVAGITDEYTRADRAVTYVAIGWTLWGLMLFAVIWIWNWISPWRDGWWFAMWRYYTVPVALAVGVVTAIWFSWGGARDLRRLFKSMADLKRNPDDDGWVNREEK